MHNHESTMMQKFDNVHFGRTIPLKPVTLSFLSNISFSWLLTCNSWKIYHFLTTINNLKTINPKLPKKVKIKYFSRKTFSFNLIKLSNTSTNWKWWGKFSSSCKTVILIDIGCRAVTVLDFLSPRWSSNKYRGLAVNRTTPPPPSKKKIDWSHLCKCMVCCFNASASACCRATAHCGRSQISLITWREALSARALHG